MEPPSDASPLRYGILGDIHSNPTALEAVLASMASDGVERFVSVGDLVGYGADPNGVVDRVRGLDPIVVAGNHDHAAAGRFEPDDFNPFAKAALFWTREALGESQRAFLESLPLTAVDDRVTVAHGTVDHPEAFQYIDSPHDAIPSLEAMKTPVAFVGHSHVPVAFLVRRGQSEGIWCDLRPTEIDLRDVDRALVNVGSVGQPRDRDPRAAYGLYDSEAKRVWIRRVPYDVEQEAQRILRAGLPRFLADRLRVGQ